MPMEYDLPQEETDKYFKDMETVINSVSSIQSNMYYIPGNVSNDLHVQWRTISINVFYPSMVLN